LASSILKNSFAMLSIAAALAGALFPTSATREQHMQRHDLYGPIHKALRAAMGDLITQIGATDFSDPAAAADTLTALRCQVAIGAGHLHHEEEHIHAALERRAPGATGRLEADHHHHEQAFAELEQLMEAIEAATGPDRERLGRDLYLRFSHFVAADLLHMAEEETVVLPLLHSLFSDEELIEMEKRIVASIPPQEMMVIMSDMIPAMHRSERVQFLSFARKGAPPEAFDAILYQAAKPNLHQGDWTHLAEAFGVAA
jgi:hypothetical protein